MTTARKIKLSVSIDADVVEAVDRRAARDGTTRSAVMEAWLRSASRQAGMARLQEETAAYYDALTAAEREDDAAWARSSARRSRRLDIDERSPRRARKG
jgi:hypothetical protein